MTNKKEKNSAVAGAPRKRGRPIKPFEPIPDTFENVIKALVQPVEKKDK